MVIFHALQMGPVPKRLGECIRKTQIQHILLEQEACTGHRDTFKLACNHVHGYVLIEASFGPTTVKRHEGDVDLNVLMKLRTITFEGRDILCNSE